jgi:hypothetical protein
VRSLVVQLDAMQLAEVSWALAVAFGRRGMGGGGDVGGRSGTRRAKREI